MNLKSRRNHKSVFMLAASLLAATGWTGAALGQAVSVAGVSGRVTDPSGGSIVNAQVKMTQIDTQYMRAVNTDPSGNYTLSNLPVGPYALEVQARDSRPIRSPALYSR